jgi:hypothetical protein
VLPAPCKGPAHPVSSIRQRLCAGIGWIDEFGRERTEHGVAEGNGIGGALRRRFRNPSS